MARTLGTVVALMLLAGGARTASFPEWASLQSWWRGWHAGDGSGAGADDVQVVYLPALLPREAQLSADRPHEDIPLPYSFDAFGRSFDLQLVPNRRLVSAQFGVWSDDGRDGALSAVDASCHFQNSGPGAVAALSACRDHALHGLIVVENSTYEVRPLGGAAGRAEAGGGGTAHEIRRAPPPPPPHDDARPLARRRRRPRIRRPKPSSYTIEVALFLDEAAYKIFHPFLNYSETDLRDMLLAYINGVQALYQHWSLGTHIQLSLVRLTLLRSQPASLPALAERGRLLDAFCAYQRSLNVDDDDDPQHWDMALLLSGMDFYSEEGGRRNGVTMGLAPVGGVCLPAHACVVSEFGTADALGRPYPSAGFTSVYILAHEIGHNLGMHHDGAGNSCARDGYIMSPSRGTNGEATWSPCSASVVADLQWATCLFDGADDTDTPYELGHNRFGGAPGAIWGAKQQCEVLLRDKDAAPSAAGAAACAQLACRTPHRAGYYYAGPALPGTPCGQFKWCQGGECVPSGVLPTTSASSTTIITPAATSTLATYISTTRSPTTRATTTRGTTTRGATMWTTTTRATTARATTTRPAPAREPWGSWDAGACRSGCTLRARGAREKRRNCSRADCDANANDVVLCDDTKVCGKKRRVSAGELAARRCAEFAARLPQLDARGGGLQAPHDPTRMWMGCAVFCRRAAGGGFYAPRVELNNAGLDPYFPDGTWCHHDGRQDYYCLQHHCLPENFKMAAQWHIWELPSEDMVGSFNAHARSGDGELEDYPHLPDTT